MFELIADLDCVAPFFDLAKDLLGADPRRLVQDSDPSQLSVNRTAQILCVLASVGLFEAIQDALPRKLCIAGYSVGEVAAWAWAGLITPAAALTLAAARAEAMDAARTGAQGLLFVRSAHRAVVDQWCEASGAAVAIINPDGGYVIGGPRKALETFRTSAEKAGTRVVDIPVDVASHTRWMADAEPRIYKAVAAVAGSRLTPGRRLLSGLDGATVFDVADGERKLARQVARTVQWDQCLSACGEAGVDMFLEPGPGQALSAMALEVHPQARARSACEFKSLTGLMNWLENT